MFKVDKLEMKSRVFAILNDESDYCFDWSEVYPWLEISSKKEAYKILKEVLGFEDSDGISYNVYLYGFLDYEIIDDDEVMRNRFYLNKEGLKKVLVRYFPDHYILRLIKEYESMKKEERLRKEIAFKQEIVKQHEKQLLWNKFNDHVDDVIKSIHYNTLANYLVSIKGYVSPDDYEVVHDALRRLSEESKKEHIVMVNPDGDKVFLYHEDILKGYFIGKDGTL